MASVRRAKYFQYVVEWSGPTESARETFRRRTEAVKCQDTHPGSTIRREECDGPVRYEVTYRDPDGKSRERRFRKKVDADRFAAEVEASKARGRFIDPRAGQVAFRAYAKEVLAHRVLAATSREQMENRFENHVYPYIGDLPLKQIDAETVARWLAGLNHLAESTRSIIYANVSLVFATAVDNDRISRNPCARQTVKATRPRQQRKKVVPWTVERVSAVYRHLPARYTVLAALGAGLGLRQGEIFGLSPDDVDRDRGIVTVRRQVLIIDSRLRFGPPKRGKTREVPLPDSVLSLLDEYAEDFPAKSVTLAWSDETGRSEIKDGTEITVPLIMTTRESKAVNRNYFNDYIWKVTLSKAGVPRTRENGTHALRHHYASVLLDGGESIRAVSEYLGHQDPGFTLRVYTHLMPASATRTKSAVDAAFNKGITKPPED